MSRATATDLVYLIAIVGFIFALIGLSSPRHARAGNLAGAVGMLIAVAWTFSLPSVYGHTRNLVLIIIGVVMGTAIGVPAARMVKMTAMPQMVAIFNGVGGGAAALVSVTEFISLPGKTIAIYKICEILFGVLVGAVSFAGSGVAFAKLQELMTGRPITYPGQQPINAAMGLAIVAVLVATVVTANTAVLVVVLVLSLVLGVIFVLPIGGADVPVLISLLNSFTGLAVAASGFTLEQQPAHRGRHPGGRIGHPAHPDDEPRHGPVHRQHPLQRVRIGHHRHRRRGGARRPIGAVGDAPRTSASFSPTPGRWPSSPGTAWPWPRRSTWPGNWPTPWRRAAWRSTTPSTPSPGACPDT